MPDGAKMPVFSDQKVERKIKACRKGNDNVRSRWRGRRGRGQGSGRSQGRGRGTRGRRGSYSKASKLDERRRLCFAFQKGACHRGASCRYIHMFEGAVGGVQQHFQLSYQPIQQPVLAGQFRAQPYPATVMAQPIQHVTPAQPIETITTSGNDLLPAGWSREFDPKHGINYYYNIYTGVSQWEKPTKPVVLKNVLTSSAPVVASTYLP